MELFAAEVRKNLSVSGALGIKTLICGTMLGAVFLGKKRNHTNTMYGFRRTDTLKENIQSEVPIGSCRALFRSKTSDQN